MKCVMLFFRFRTTIITVSCRRSERRSTAWTGAGADKLRWARLVERVLCARFAIVKG